MDLRLKNKYTYIVVALFFSIAFFSRCARPAAPMGGPMDTLAPVVIAVYPANYTTNFNSKEIILRFNEYLQLKDVQKNVLFSPPLAATPIITVKGKSIVVKFPPELKLDSATTYRIDFGAAIGDNNEGNLAKRLEYVFSTGDVIDSLVMSGKLVDAKTGADIINGVVVLYEYPEEIIIPDSTIFKGKKVAFARTDSSGNFLVANLKPMDYMVFALKDENGNGDYDMGSDLIGFTNTKLNPSKMKEFKVWIDPVRDVIEVSPQFKLALFEEQRRMPQSVIEVKRNKEPLLDFVFASDSVKIDSVSIYGIPKRNIIIENNTYNDSIRVWVRTVDLNMVPDTLKGFIYYQGVDSIGQPTQKKSDFALRFFKKDNEKSSTSETIKAVTGIFKKMGNWIHNLFKSKKRKEVEYLRGLRKIRLDSIAKVRADSIYRVQSDSILSVTTFRDSLARAEFLRKMAAGRDSLYIRKDSKKGFIPKLLPSGDVNPSKKIYLISEAPLEYIDTAMITLDRLSFPERDEDSFDESDVDLNKKPTIRTRQKVSFKTDTSDYTRLILDLDIKSGSEYEMVMPKDVVMDIAGYFNDSVSFKFKAMDADNMAKVTVDVKLLDSNSNKSYIAVLLDSTNVEMDRKPIKGQGRLVFDYLPEKNYKLMFVEDVNGNGKQDFGIVLRRIEPEQSAIFLHNGKDALFPTKIKWDVSFDVYPEALFDEKIKVPGMKRREDDVNVDKINHDHHKEHKCDENCEHDKVENGKNK